MTALTRLSTGYTTDTRRMAGLHRCKVERPCPKQMVEVAQSGVPLPAAGSAERLRTEAGPGPSTPLRLGVSRGPAGTRLISSLLQPLTSNRPHGPGEWPKDPQGFHRAAKPVLATLPRRGSRARYRCAPLLRPGRDTSSSDQGSDDFAARPAGLLDTVEPVLAARECHRPE